MNKADPHYQAIQEYYGDIKAERSGVPYINHIDEGLIVLDEIRSSTRAKQAFCLHPIVQTNTELQIALSDDSPLDRHNTENGPLILAMEYRKVANAYSASHKEKPIDQIRLSPLPEVNQMLIADKVQNRADFEEFIKADNPRSTELSKYFRNWLARLEVDEEQYRALVKAMKQ